MATPRFQDDKIIIHKMEMRALREQYVPCGVPGD